MSKQIKHIRAGDEVVVITGKDKGKTGEVIKVLPESEKVLVKDVNVVIDHQRQTQQSQPSPT